MAQYIDKSALVAEIKKRLSLLEGGTGHPEVMKRVEGVIKGYKSILSFIDTLEVKEVDLDLEIALWANAIPEIRLDDVERLATYFFELGLKARKGE